MRILLINICLRPDSALKYIPVGLSCIATTLNKAGFRPDILDIDLHRYSDTEIDDFLRSNNRYDIVGFGNIVSGYKHTKRVAIQVKKAMPDTLLIVGNTVATSIPELLLKCVPHIDIAVIGEGDQTIVDIVTAKAAKRSWQSVPGIAYRDGGKVVFTEKRKAIPRMSDILFPDYSLFDAHAYVAVSNKTVPEPFPPMPVDALRALPVNTARGCPYDCTFCSHAFKEYKYRYYDFTAVAKYIKHLQDMYDVNYIHFWDELTIFSADRLRELCDAIEKENLHFYWPIPPRVNTFASKDLGLLRRSKDLGALLIGGAFESADENILVAMNKRIDIEKYVEQVDVAKKAGLEVRTSLVFGYPQETEATIKKTVELCRRLRIYPSAGFVLPLPGTQIYDYAIRNGFIKDEEEYLLRIGDRQDVHVNLTQLPDDVLMNTVKEELIKLKNDLGVQIADDKVIKTGVHRIARSNQ